MAGKKGKLPAAFRVKKGSKAKPAKPGGNPFAGGAKAKPFMAKKKAAKKKR